MSIHAVSPEFNVPSCAQAMLGAIRTSAAAELTSIAVVVIGFMGVVLPQHMALERGCRAKPGTQPRVDRESGSRETP